MADQRPQRPTAYDELIKVAQARLEVSPDDDSRVARARRALSAGVPTMLAPTPPAKAQPKRHTRWLRRTTIFVALLLPSAGALSVAIITVGNHTTLLDFTGLTRDTQNSPPIPTTPTSATAAAPTVVALPRPDAWALPIRRPDGDVSGIVEGVVTALNEQRAAEAEAQALAEQAAAQQPNSGGSTGTGTNTGGGSTGGGTSNGGGGQNPPPPPASFVDQLGFTASSAVGGISVSASVHTTGSMNVTVQCTSAGTTINLAGPNPLDGGGSYSGSFTGLAPGTYQISCAVPGQLSSNTKNITVYE